MAATTPVDWRDPLCLSAQLSDAQRQVQRTAHDYCQQRLMPRILEANHHERFDPSIMTEMGALGLLGATLDGHGAAGSITSAMG